MEIFDYKLSSKEDAEKIKTSKIIKYYGGIEK